MAPYFKDGAKIFALIVETVRDTIKDNKWFVFAFVFCFPLSRHLSWSVFEASFYSVLLLRFRLSFHGKKRTCISTATCELQTIS